MALKRTDLFSVAPTAPIRRASMSPLIAPDGWIQLRTQVDPLREMETNDATLGLESWY
jgi:hypothetical protein